MAFRMRIASQRLGLRISGTNNAGANVNTVYSRAISSSALTIERTTSDDRFNNKPPNDELKFGVTLPTICWNVSGRPPRPGERPE